MHKLAIIKTVSMIAAGCRAEESLGMAKLNPYC